MTDAAQNYEFDPQVTLSLSKKLQLLGLIIDFSGALIFAMPLFKSRKEVEEASKVYIGVSPYQLRTRERDRKLTICGLSVIMVGFALQAFALFV